MIAFSGCCGLIPLYHNLGVDLGLLQHRLSSLVSPSSIYSKAFSPISPVAHL